MRRKQNGDFSVWNFIQFLFGMSPDVLTVKVCILASGSKFWIWVKGYYSPIAFDQRVTFWLPLAQSLLCGVCLLHCMRMRLRNAYTQAHAQIMQHTYKHKVLTGCVEAKTLLSRQRQSQYSERHSQLDFAHSFQFHCPTNFARAINLLCKASFWCV